MFALLTALLLAAPAHAAERDPVVSPRAPETPIRKRVPSRKLPKVLRGTWTVVPGPAPTRVLNGLALSLDPSATPEQAAALGLTGEDLTAWSVRHTMGRTLTGEQRAAQLAEIDAIRSFSVTVTDKLLAFQMGEDELMQNWMLLEASDNALRIAVSEPGTDLRTIHLLFSDRDNAEFWEDAELRFVLSR